MYTCYGCQKRLEWDEVSQGMNLPDVTPGPIYYCHTCVPAGSAQELIESTENFLNPPKEKGFN